MIITPRLGLPGISQITAPFGPVLHVPAPAAPRTSTLVITRSTAPESVKSRP